MTTVFKKYAAILIPAFVIIVGGIQALEAEPTWTGVITFILLLLSAALTFGVKLVDAKWAGILKTGIPIIATILAVILPFVTQGTFTIHNIPLVLIAVLQAIGTELGVYIRTDDETTPDQAAVLVPTGLPSTAQPAALSGVTVPTENQG